MLKRVVVGVLRSSISQARSKATGGSLCDRSIVQSWLIPFVTLSDSKRSTSTTASRCFSPGSIGRNCSALYASFPYHYSTSFHFYQHKSLGHQNVKEKTKHHNHRNPRRGQDEPLRAPSAEHWPEPPLHQPSRQRAQLPRRMGRGIQELGSQRRRRKLPSKPNLY